MVEAKRRDHRVLGKKLDLFSLQEDAGGGLVSKAQDYGQDETAAVLFSFAMYFIPRYMLSFTCATRCIC